MTLTPKQKAWDASKLAKRAEGPRGVATTIATVRKRIPCTCTPVKHTPKHHRLRGGCRKGCPCNAGANR